MHIYSSVNFIYQVVCYIPSTYLSGSLYPLTAFIQFLLPPRSATGNHKPGLFFCEFVCLFLKYN